MDYNKGQGQFTRSFTIDLMSIRSYKHLLSTFWYKPAWSVRQLLDLQQGHSSALFVAALFGMIQLGRLFPVSSEVLIVYLAFYGLAGVGFLFLFGWLVRNFGRFFGVDARQREVRTALGLGLLPWTILFGSLLLALSSGLSSESIAARYSSIVLVVLIYGFYVLLLSLKAALHLSVIKTFLCLILTVVFSFFPLTLLAQLLSSHLK